MTGTAQARQELSAGAVLAAIETYRICLIPGLEIWQASADVLGERHNKKRAVRSVSAIDSTCMGAVSRLMALLEEEK